MTNPGQPGDQQPYNQPHGTNQPYGAAPYPPQKKKRKVWPWIVIGVPVLLIGACTAILAGSMGGDEETSVTKASGTSTAAEAAGPGFPGKLDDDTVALGGDTITRDNLEYTVAPLTPVNTTFGNYLCSTVTIKNVGDKQNDFNSYIDWSLQDATGTIRDATFAPEREPLNSGEIAPGGQTAGDVCFDSRQGSPAGTYVVLFEDTFSLSSDRLAWVNTL
ncbi:uncharacterized protein DUF4352 [Williamsia limnetica]|jgi:hypothetical protein|uniref:Uncharacterized protein DUF4352 n=1 Tax=Williamsia limnetica TaxID=882452 RepID=A0A318RPV1_WILLI|nr:DUF4352 domain-containing protein [Williamsia limnetica]PYE18446.1 uncharacterized protein DUF4352 [Williamsia limnetica]